MNAATVWLPHPGQPGARLRLGVRGDWPVLGPSVRTESRGVKRLADLRPVSGGEPDARAGRRIQYWTFSGVGDEEHYERLRGLPVSYDLTFMASRPIGWERPKTHGHCHVRDDGAPGGYPEVYEVLHGHAGFLFQDLRAGPAATFAVLVTAAEGEPVVIPPLSQHCTINLADSPLVVANLVCRTAGHDYLSLRGARGMAYYAARDGGMVPNPGYLARPALQVYDAAEWSAGPGALPRQAREAAEWPGESVGSLYGELVSQPGLFDWLCEPADAIALPP